MGKNSGGDGEISSLCSRIGAREGVRDGGAFERENSTSFSEDVGLEGRTERRQREEIKFGSWLIHGKKGCSVKCHRYGNDVHVQ